MTHAGAAAVPELAQALWPGGGWPAATLAATDDSTSCVSHGC